MNHPAFTFQIVCRSGVLMTGKSADFLVTVQEARRYRLEALRMLPASTFRVCILNPNGSQVSKSDLKAAVISLNDAALASVVEARKARAFQAVLAVGVEAAFSQAGVVAPLDSPDLGTLPQNNSTLKAAIL